MSVAGALALGRARSEHVNALTMQSSLRREPLEVASTRSKVEAICLVYMCSSQFWSMMGLTALQGEPVDADLCRIARRIRCAEGYTKDVDRLGPLNFLKLGSRASSLHRAESLRVGPPLPSVESRQGRLPALWLAAGEWRSSAVVDAT